MQQQLHEAVYKPSLPSPKKKLNVNFSNFRSTPKYYPYQVTTPVDYLWYCVYDATVRRSRARIHDEITIKVSDHAIYYLLH